VPESVVKFTFEQILCIKCPNSWKKVLTCLNVINVVLLPFFTPVLSKAAGYTTFPSRFDLLIRALTDP
jgi:hypothetical protein